MYIIEYFKKTIVQFSVIQITAILGLSLLLIILPSFSPFFEIPWNAKRYFQIILLLFIGIVAVISRDKTDILFRITHVFPKFINILLFGLLIIGVLSSLLSNHIHYALLEVSVFAVLFILLFFVIDFYHKYESIFIKILLSTIVLMVGLYFVRFTINYIYHFIFSDWPVWPHTRYFDLVINGESFYPKPFLGFVYERYLNHLHTWTIPLLTYAIVAIPKRYWSLKVITGFLTSFWWILVFASDARGTMVSSVFSLVLVILIFRNQIKDWIKTYAATFTVGLIAYFLLFKVFISGGGRSFLNRYSASGRMQMAENVFELFKTNPFLGIGPMHYADISNGFRAAHPHNFVLQIIGEWGIIAFVFASMIFIYGFFKWIKFCNNNDTNDSKSILIKATLTASLSAGVVHSLVSGVMHSPLSQILCVLIVGWTIGFYQNSLGFNLNFDTSLSSIQSWLVRSFILIIVLFVGWSTYHTYKGLEKNRIMYLDQTNSNKLYPRFWDHGIIGVEESELNEINNADSP